MMHYAGVHPAPWICLRSKIRYFSQEVFGDLGLHGVRTSDFWFTWALTLLALWGRMYTHFFGQWMFMKVPRTIYAIAIPAELTVDLNLFACRPSVFRYLAFSCKCTSSR